jgi:hypothetical protein
MRTAWLVGSLVVLLTLGVAVDAGARGPPTARPPGDEIDLGTATLGHLEVAAGPLRLALGLFDRLQIGTYPPGYALGVVMPGSFVASAFAKVRIFQHDEWSASVRTALFHGRLGQVGKERVRLRGWLWPTRLVLATEWNREFATSLELTGVYAALNGETSVNTTGELRGIAMARALHAGFIPRLRLHRWLTVFLRNRMLVGHWPVVIRADSQFSDTTRASIDARANAAELTSGFASVAGLHLHWPFLSITVAGGYGTWFIPLIDLPIGDARWIAEFDIYFRF